MKIETIVRKSEEENEITEVTPEYRQLSKEEIDKIRNKLGKDLFNAIPVHRRLTKEEAMELGEKYNYKWQVIPAQNTGDERMARSINGHLIIRVTGVQKGYKTKTTKLQESLNSMNSINENLTAVISDYFADIENYSGVQQQTMRIMGFEKIIDRLEKLTGLKRENEIVFIFDDPFSAGYVDPSTKKDESEVVCKNEEI